MLNIKIYKQEYPELNTIYNLHSSLYNQNEILSNTNKKYLKFNDIDFNLYYLDNINNFCAQQQKLIKQMEENLSEFVAYVCEDKMIDLLKKFNITQSLIYENIQIYSKNIEIFKQEIKTTFNNLKED